MKKMTRRVLKGFLLTIIITTMFMSTVVEAQVKDTIDVMFNIVNIDDNKVDTTKVLDKLIYTDDTTSKDVDPQLRDRLNEIYDEGKHLNVLSVFFVVRPA